MCPNWNFPLYNFGRRQGISGSGVETFRGERYRHLAKEICQNSLDAVKNDEDVVEVEFQHIYIDKEEIPGYERYLQVFKQCYKGSKDSQGKAKDFFSYANEILSKEKISVLRISDFNTTGLTGSKKEKDTPWNDLIKAAGISNKKAEAGGSFGIGKYAAFACSNLRTVFYSTYDEDGIEASQGIAEVINFIDVDGKEREAEGFYGVGEKNLPIFKQLKLDPNFERGERTGTDIYILGFIEQDDWVESIVYSVVDSFLIAIYNGKLRVKVGDVLINKSTLEDIVKNQLDYKKSGRSRNSLEFYKVLTSDETIVKEFPLETRSQVYLGKFKIYLLVDNELSSRRVLMSRINGMKVFEQDRFPRGIPFAGICILQDKKLNDYFRKMETPEHDAWKADQFSENPKEIKEANETRLKLIRIIRDELNNLAKKTTLDETDVEDLGLLLPDLEDDFLGDKGKKESLSNDGKKSKVNIEIEKIKNKDTGAKGYGREKKSEGFERSKSGKASSDSSNKRGSRKKRVALDFLKIRVFKIDKSSYRMFFETYKDLEDTELLISAIGEDRGAKLNIALIRAEDKTNNRSLEIKNNKILLGNLSKGSQLIIDFEPDIVEQLSMEVIVYAS